MPQTLTVDSAGVGFLKGLEPDPDENVAEWSDANRYLSSEASAESGRWRTERVPYTRAIMEALTPGSPYTKVVLMKGSQIAGTEIGNNLIGYIIDRTPGPILHIMPTDSMAEDNSKTRIDTLIENSPSLRAKVKPKGSKQSGNTIFMKEFPGGFLSMTGGKSAAKLRSKPIRFLIISELDALEKDVSNEGDPLNLARVRTRTYGRRKKIYLESSPKIKGESRIESEYERTNMQKLFVPCPYCEHYQVLRFDRLKWDKGNYKSVRYVCEECEGEIKEHEKTKMLAFHEWRATNPNPAESDAIGFHVSALYSPLGWYSWEEVAADWDEAQGDPDKLKTFINTVLGETWADKGEAPDWEILFNRADPDLKRGIMPLSACIATIGADVQRDRIEATVVAWARGKRSYQVDHHVFPGITDNIEAEPWKQLTELLDTYLDHESGVEIPIRGLAIDTGYQANIVYSWARQFSPGRVFACKSHSSESYPMITGQPRAVDVKLDGRKISRGVKLWTVGAGLVKDELYAWLKLPRKRGEDYPPGWCHFPGWCDPEFFKQLCAESKVKRRKGPRGKVTFAYEPHYSRNEVLDCRMLARVAAHILGLDRMKDEHWDNLEAEFGTEPPGTKTKAEKRTRSSVLGGGLKL